MTVHYINVSDPEMSCSVNLKKIISISDVYQVPNQEIEHSGCLAKFVICFDGGVEKVIELQLNSVSMTEFKRVHNVLLQTWVRFEA